jgi:hypothetical protein
MKKITLLLLPFLFCSCAKNIVVNYEPIAGSSGQIVLHPSGKTPNTFLTIDDKLIIANKRVKSITVNNVPAGERKVHFMSNSSNYKEKVNGEFLVNVETGKSAVKLVELPPYSGGYWAAQIIGSVGSAVLGIVMGSAIYYASEQ